MTLRRGVVDLASFKAGVERISGGQAVGFNTRGDVAAQVRRSLRLQAQALRLFAALAGVAGLLILAQALARLAFLEGRDNPTLGALGMTRSQRWAVAMLRSAAIALAGAVLAGVGAVVTSPLMPSAWLARWNPHPAFPSTSRLCSSAPWA